MNLVGPWWKQLCTHARSFRHAEMFLIKPASEPHALLALFCGVPSIHDHITRSEAWDLNYDL